MHVVDMMMMIHNNKTVRDLWWWNDLIWWYSILIWHACIKCHDALRQRVFKDTTLVNDNHDECMKANVCMLLRVIYERCICCVIKMKTTEISCILCVHRHQNTSQFMMMSTDAYIMMMMVMPHMTLRGLLISERHYGQLARLWWVQGGRTAWGPTLSRVSHV